MRRFLPVICIVGVAAAVFVCGWTSIPDHPWRTPFYRNLELDTIHLSWHVFRRTPWFSVTLRLSIAAGVLTGLLWLVSHRRRQGIRGSGGRNVAHLDRLIETFAWFAVVVVMGVSIMYSQELGLLGHH